MSDTTASDLARQLLTLGFVERLISGGPALWREAAADAEKLGEDAVAAVLRDAADRAERAKQNANEVTDGG